MDSGLLHFLVGQEPDQRLVVEIDDLNAIAPRVAEIAAEWRDEFEAVFFDELLAHFRQLPFIADHNPEVAHAVGLDFLDLEHRQELMFAQLEEGVAFALLKLFEIEDVLIKGDRLVNITDFDGDVVASVNFHTHGVS